MVLRLLVLTTMALSLPIQAAERVDIPLNIDLRYLKGQVSTALGMDDDGRLELMQDNCNRVRLSDMALQSVDGRLQIAMSASSIIGFKLFGTCRGLGPWNNRMTVDLAPEVDDNGLVINLQPATAELLRTDGSKGLLARPIRLIAETHIVPRMGTANVDLRPALSALDGLVQQAMSGSRADLLGHSRITSVAITEAGLAAVLRVDVDLPTQAKATPVEPLNEEELVKWQRLEDELDGFLTVIISHLALQLDDRALQLDMLAVLIDARRAITRALEVDARGPDPVRRLFLNIWDNLRPVLQQAELSGTLTDDTGLRLAAFIAGGDALRAVDALGPEYGIEITRDGLRRMARLLLNNDAPASFTPLPLDINPALRELFFPDQPLFPLDRNQPGNTTAWLLDLLISSARADTLSPAERLRGVVPRIEGLNDYLQLVSLLLDQEAQAMLGGKSRVPEQFRHLVKPLVRATAWKESCWRQNTGPVNNPRVLSSSVGALGMMQIYARVWRGVYDQERLASDVQYNVFAGVEILQHYLVDYAIRRKEHEQPGGAENLVRATYSAYNGGPGHLSRYRREDVKTSLRIIDREFFRHYQRIKTDHWPELKTCYPVP